MFWAMIHAMVQVHYLVSNAALNCLLYLLLKILDGAIVICWWILARETVLEGVYAFVQFDDVAVSTFLGAVAGLDYLRQHINRQKLLPLLNRPQRRQDLLLIIIRIQWLFHIQPLFGHDTPDLVVLGGNCCLDKVLVIYVWPLVLVRQILKARSDWLSCLSYLDFLMKPHRTHLLVTPYCVLCVIECKLVLIQSQQWILIVAWLSNRVLLLILVLAQLLLEKV